MQALLHLPMFLSQVFVGINVIGVLAVGSITVRELQLNVFLIHSNR